MKTRVRKMTFGNFPKEIVMPTVILFSRDGCHFCQNLKPVYNQISIMERYKEVYDFYIIDADEEEFLYEKFESDGVPTIYVIYGDDGLEIPYPEKPCASGYSKKDITSFLDKLME
jgi:thioredoxin-like negative regulator of GroEL